MVVQRKRFRIEDIVFGNTPTPEEIGNDVIPMHREIMTELRAIREQMGAPSRGAASDITDATSQQVADAQVLLQTYRAQIEQCEKLKIELDLIHDAISRTKQEIAVLHGKSFNGTEMAKVTGGPMGSPSPYHLITELYFADEAALNAAMSSEAGAETGKDFMAIATPGSFMTVASVVD